MPAAGLQQLNAAGKCNLNAAGRRILVTAGDPCCCSGGGGFCCEAANDTDASTITAVFSGIVSCNLACAFLYPPSAAHKVIEFNLNSTFTLAKPTAGGCNWEVFLPVVYDIDGTTPITPTPIIYQQGDNFDCGDMGNIALVGLSARIRIYKGACGRWYCEVFAYSAFRGGSIFFGEGAHAAGSCIGGADWSCEHSVTMDNINDTALVFSCASVSHAPDYATGGSVTITMNP